MEIKLREVRVGEVEERRKKGRSGKEIGREEVEERRKTKEKT